MNFRSALQTRASRGLLSLPFFMLVCLGCRQTDESQHGSAQPSPIAPIAVAVRAPLTNTLNVAGQFLPFQEVELHARVAGYIQHISVDIGDKVKVGQVIATLDIPELTAQVKGADAGVRQSQDQINRARSEIQRAEANYDALHSAAQRLQQASNATPA